MPFLVAKFFDFNFIHRKVKKKGENRICKKEEEEEAAASVNLKKEYERECKEEEEEEESNSNQSRGCRPQSAQVTA